MVKVELPFFWQEEIKASNLEIEAENVKELLEKLVNKFPSLKTRIYQPSGQLNKFINLYVNEKDIRFLKKEETPLKDKDTLRIIVPIAGG